MELAVFWISAAIVVGIIGRHRGRSGFGWFLLALLLSPLLAGVLVLVLTNKNAERMLPSLADGTGRKCSSCAEIVRYEALKCRYCGTELAPPVVSVSAAAPDRPGNETFGYIYFVIIIAALAVAMGLGILSWLTNS